MTVMSNNKRFALILLAALGLLLIPLIAMQFTSEVAWSVFDFIVMGILLVAVGSMLEIILRRVKGTNNRIAFIVILLLVFLLVWAELAVGVFGTPFAGS